jgi:hypothetical protein
MEINVLLVQNLLTIIKVQNNVLNVRMEKFITIKQEYVNVEKINLYGQDHNVLHAFYHCIMITILNNVNNVQQDSTSKDQFVNVFLKVDFYNFIKVL